MIYTCSSSDKVNLNENTRLKLLTIYLQTIYAFFDPYISYLLLIYDVI